jgi:plastocyanin
MIRRQLWLSACTTLLSVTAVLGADPAQKGGIIKGTITVAGKPTEDVVVSIEGIPAEQVTARISAMKTKMAQMDQKNMKFIPRVLPVLVGTSVDFPNRDSNWHNLYSTSEAKKFDLGLYAPGKSRSATFDKPGVVKILCNVHPNMEGYIVVKEHPFFSRADAKGNYQIRGVPLGTYRVEVWHPELGTTETGVEIVRDGEVVAINFDLKKK